MKMYKLSIACTLMFVYIWAAAALVFCLIITHSLCPFMIFVEFINFDRADFLNLNHLDREKFAAENARCVICSAQGKCTFAGESAHCRTFCTLQQPSRTKKKILSLE